MNAGFSFSLHVIWWDMGRGHFRHDLEGAPPDHEGGVSWATPRGMWIVMLDSVGSPSGVQVKKPPMICLATHHHPEENREAAGFAVGKSLASPPQGSQKTPPPVPGSPPRQRSGRIAFLGRPLSEAPSPRGQLQSLPTRWRWKECPWPRDSYGPYRQAG